MADSEKLERKRRSQKSAFKRFEDILKINFSSNRTTTEVKEDFEKLERKYKDCEAAHCEYCLTLDDSVYASQEDWMDDIESRFNEMRLATRDYVEKMSMTPLGTLPADPVSSSVSKSKIATEKLPYPKFSGKISEYLIFKRDWREVVELRYGKSAETLYLLKRSVSESVRKWVESISDYSTAWRILDEQYGNPRWISDQLINDLKKIGAINNTNQFIELYHACTHAYGILKELDRIQDLDNSTFLGILEKKLTIDDRTSWAKSQRKENIEPSVKTLIKWMDDQIWIKKVASAEIRSSGSGSSSGKTFSAEMSDEMSDISENAMLDQGLVAYEEQALLLCGFSVQDSSYKPAPCWVCDSGEHKITDCKRFKAFSPDIRLEKTREKKACYFCLRRHRFPCMKQRMKCPEKTATGEQCQFFHHPLLHGAKFEKKVSETKGDCECAQVSGSSKRLLPIVTTVAKNEESLANRKVNCLLDSGSQLTLIRDSVARNLKLYGDDTELEITGVGGITRKHQTKIYSIVLAPLGNKPPVEIQAIGIPQIGQNQTKLDTPAVTEMFGIQESDIYRDDGPVDILIGVDPHADFHTGLTRQVGKYVLRDSILGLVIFGCQDSENTQCHNSVHVNFDSDPKDITRFWNTEELGVTLNWCCQQRNKGERLMTAVEKRDEAEVRKSAKKVGDQWQIPLPWGRDPNNLPNNYIQALLKLQSLEKRLSKNPEHAKMYSEQVDQLVSAGSARILTRDELESYEGPIHYMSHHAVLKPDKVTHPCRMIFNQAESFKGHVINKYLKKCGDHLNNMIGVLLRWREEVFVLVGDVRKMYHQILTCPGTDQNTHRFLWRNLEDREPDIYIKTVLTFGDVSSPALANITMDMTADEYQDKYPESSTAIKQNRYMDDFADSYSTIQKLETRKKEIDEILVSGHFQIKAWMTNTNLDSKSGGGRESGEEIEKVLGVPWNRAADQISISMNIPSSLTLSLTKRIITGIMAGIYDVFGLGVPVIVSGKIKLQNLWRLKFDWDDCLSECEELQREWIQWLDEIRKLKEMNFERCLTPESAVGSPDLVIFCDSSKKAFGAVGYCRYKIEDGSATTRFIMAKSRVAPLKTLSLPRLELQSVLVGSRLYETIKIESRLKFKNVYILTDSLTQ